MAVQLQSNCQFCPVLKSRKTCPIMVDCIQANFVQPTNLGTPGCPYCCFWHSGCGYMVDCLEQAIRLVRLAENMEQAVNDL